MFRYETHLHTAPVSKCADAGVRETLLFYKSLGYDGVFITNHFLDGNINIDKKLPYREKLDFFLSDYYHAKEESEKIGIKVFFGVEISYGGTDFLIYGLSPEWYYEHPEIMEIEKSEELALMRKDGAFIVHAHPFIEARYIDHIRLYPRSVDAVEVNNSSRGEFENRLAGQYADNYGLFKVAGADNHHAYKRHLAGIECEKAIDSENDYGIRVREGDAHIFTLDPDSSDHECVIRDSSGILTVRLLADPSKGEEWTWEMNGDGKFGDYSKEYTKRTEDDILAKHSFAVYRFSSPSPGDLTLCFTLTKTNEPQRYFYVKCAIGEDGKISLIEHDFVDSPI